MLALEYSRLKFIPKMQLKGFHAPTKSILDKHLTYPILAGREFTALKVTQRPKSHNPFHLNLGPKL